MNTGRLRGSFLVKGVKLRLMMLMSERTIVACVGVVVVSWSRTGVVDMFVT